MAIEFAGDVAVDPFQLKDEDGYFWLKGNLHTHTTNSDGKVAPQVRVDGYVEQGYDYLCLSDHDRITFVDSVTAPEGFVLIQGAELHPDNPFGGQKHHFVCLNLNKDMAAQHMPPQHVIDEVNRQGGAVFLALPTGARSISTVIPHRSPASPVSRSSTPPAASPGAASRACSGTTGWSWKTASTPLWPTTIRTP